MRILLLAQFYPPVLGGEERHVQALGRALRTRGHDVAVVTLAAGAPTIEDDEGVRVYRIRGTASRLRPIFADAQRRHVPPLVDPEIALALRGIVRRERPDVVHAHDWIVHSFVPLKRWSGARVVLTLHDYGLICAKKSLVFRESVCDGPALGKCLECASAHYGAAKGIATVAGVWAMAPVLRRAVDMFVAVSGAVARGNRLRQLGMRYRVIPNFVAFDGHGSNGAGAELAAQLPERYFLFAGDVRRFKGVDVLLRAHAALRDAVPLVLAGRICADAPASYPPGVITTGPWPHEAVLAAWDRSLAGVAPSIGVEPMPTAVLEAMRSGRPVVASRIGGIPDVVADGETGFLVPPGDADALSRAMQRLADDDALRERMGQAARARVASFEAEAIVPRIESLYAELLASGRNGEPRA